MPDEPVTVTAVFANTRYAVTVDPGVEGTMLFSVNGGEYIASVSAKYNDTVAVRYTYENTSGTRKELTEKLTYSYTSGGKTAKRPMNDQMVEGNVYYGTFIMPALVVVAGVDYVGSYTVTLSEVENGSISAGEFSDIQDVPIFRKQCKIISVIIANPKRTVWI